MLVIVSIINLDAGLNLPVVGKAGMAFYNLHRQFVDFAAGMPAFGISWNLIQGDVTDLFTQLRGTNPNAPAAAMGNIRMPVYGLAYSVFLTRLQVQRNGNAAELDVKLTANVHLLHRPDQVIRSYEIETTQPPQLALLYDDRARELYWHEQGSKPPNITPSWGPNVDTVLAHTSIADPKRENYLKDVEQQIIWLTGPTFVSLVTGVLPRIKLGQILPWLQFLQPLRFSIEPEHVLVTAPHAKVTVGTCTPETIDIDPDPAFPYGKAIPAPTGGPVPEMAVYIPRTRLINFFAKQIEPAILVSDSGGGVIKWQIAGSVGLKQLLVDVYTASGLTGVISLAAKVDFVAGAQAWVDGPSGSRLSLASASVLGDGDLAANITITLDANTGTIEATLTVTRSDINPHWDVHTPFDWPLDAVASEVLNHISRGEAAKLAGMTARLGRWNVLGLPAQYLNTFTHGDQPIGDSDGLAGVSAMISVLRKRG